MVDRKNVVIFVFTARPALRFLLLKRIPERSGYWQPVTGGIEPGEQDVEVCMREVYEETGITEYLRLIDLHHSFIYLEPKNHILMEMQDFCYALEIPRIADITLSEEHEQYLWLDAEGVRQHLDWENGQAAFTKLLDIISS